jgi:hypothetical protein
MASTAQQTRRNSDSTPTSRFQPTDTRPGGTEESLADAAGQHLAMALWRLARELLGDEAAIP